MKTSISPNPQQSVCGFRHPVGQPHAHSTFFNLAIIPFLSKTFQIVHSSSLCKLNSLLIISCTVSHVIFKQIMREKFSTVGTLQLTSLAGKTSHCILRRRSWAVCHIRPRSISLHFHSKSSSSHWTLL